MDVLHAFSLGLIEGLGKVVGHGRDGTAFHTVDKMVDIPIAHLADYLMTLGHEAVCCI